MNSRNCLDLDLHKIEIEKTADDVDAAEDRERFDEILEKCHIDRPRGDTVFTVDEAIAAANGEVITLVNSTEEEIDLSTVEATIVAGRKGLTVHGVEIEF